MTVKAPTCYIVYRIEGYKSAVFFNEMRTKIHLFVGKHQHNKIKWSSELNSSNDIR